MRRKAEFSQSSLRILENAKQVAINSPAEQFDSLFDIENFPNISSDELLSWLIYNSGLYIDSSPPHHHGYAAFQALHSKIEKDEQDRAKDINTITAKLSTGRYSELTDTGVADAALKLACSTNNANQVAGLLQAGAYPSRPTIAEIAQYQLLDKKTVATLILGGVDSQIILENIHPNNQNRESIVAIVAQDQALLSGFNSLKDAVKEQASSLGLSNLSDQQIIDLIESAMYTQGGFKALKPKTTNSQDPFLEEFREALSLTYFQEFVADVIGLFSDQGRDAYRAEIITAQLKEVFDNTRV